MLDQKYNPWLLEVNLSPGCAERTAWLQELLDKMTDGLFDILESKIITISDNFSMDLRNYLLQSKARNHSIS